MKKNRKQGEEQNRKLRRLSLNRETIRALDDLTFLELARGGGGGDVDGTSSNGNGIPMCETSHCY